MYHDDYSEKIFSRRAFVLGGLQFLGLCVLGGRLAWLQVAQGRRYKLLSDKNRINLKILPPSRGHIVDRFGVPLAVNIQNYRALIIPEQTKDLKESLEAIQNIIDIDERDIQRVMKQAKSTAKYIPLKIKEDLTWEEVAKIEVNLPDLPGLSVDRGEVRTYPYRDATAHIVGYVRAISKDALKNNPDPVFKIPGFKIGKTGIEKVYDTQLRGKSGTSEVEVNVIGREVQELRRTPPVLGKRVTLTIDGELQRFVQEALSEHKSASAVIMDAHTGAIYAMASHPTFDPNAFVRGLSNEEWAVIRDDPTLPQTNKAVSGQYPPGSTFKMITALAGLRAGVIDRHTSVYCPGYYEYGTDRFHCWKKSGHGNMNVTTALEQSCDTFFYKMATDVGINKIAEMGREFGLGDVLGVDMAEEKPGLMPDKAWKLKRYGRHWQHGETIVSSIGQGSILTTPLQLAAMTARLVNGGVAVKPWITGYLDNKFIAQKDWPNMNIPKDHLDLVMNGMDRVVNAPQGTAHENPRYVCAVVIEHGVGGSSAAAPMAKKLLLQTQMRDPALTKMHSGVIHDDSVLQHRVRPQLGPLHENMQPNDQGGL